MRAIAPGKSHCTPTALHRPRRAPSGEARGNETLPVRGPLSTSRAREPLPQLPLRPYTEQRANEEEHCSASLMECHEQHLRAVNVVNMWPIIMID